MNEEEKKTEETIVERDVSSARMNLRMEQWKKDDCLQKAEAYGLSLNDFAYRSMNSIKLPPMYGTIGQFIQSIHYLRMLSKEERDVEIKNEMQEVLDLSKETLKEVINSSIKNTEVGEK